MIHAFNIADLTRARSSNFVAPNRRPHSWVKYMQEPINLLGWNSIPYGSEIAATAHRHSSTLPGTNSVENVLHNLSHQDEFFWTKWISEYTKHGRGREALRLYKAMLEKKVPPKSYTFVAALKACSSIGDLVAGKEIHSHVIENGHHTDIFVASSLIDMYSRCGSILDASWVFEKMTHPDTVSWNALITGYVHLDMANSALTLYKRMQIEGFIPNNRTFIASLRACCSLAVQQSGNAQGKASCLELGRHIHAQIASGVLDSDPCVTNTLIDMYAKCGSIEDARHVFESMSQRTVVSWTPLIIGYARMEHGEAALQLYNRMQQEGFKPDGRTFVAALKACRSLAAHEEGKAVNDEFVKVKCLEQGRSIHIQLTECGLDSDIFIACSLIDLYAKCGSMVYAREVFEKMPCRDVVTWNAMIMGYAQMQMSKQVMELFVRMQQEGFRPDDRTFVAALKACGNLAEQEELKEVDGKFVKTWCLEKGKEIHAQATMLGYEFNIFVANTLIDMYPKCGSIADAYEVFKNMPSRDPVSWTAMIMGYVLMEMGDSALQLYTYMQTEGFSPNERTFVAALKACGILAIQITSKELDSELVKARCLEQGRAIHNQVTKSGLESDKFIANTLIDMYAKCGSIVEARQVFDRMSSPDLISWTVMIMAYAQMEMGEQALQLYTCMQHEGLKPNDRTFVAALKACGSVAVQNAGKKVDVGHVKRKFLEQGRIIHSQITKSGFESDLFVANTLLDMYAKCGSITDAYEVFEKMPRRDLISWTAMIMAYAQMEMGEMALQLYERMQHEGFTPNTRTFVAAIKACSSLGVQEAGKDVHCEQTKDRSLEMARVIHAQAANSGLESDVFVASALVDLYSNCGNIVDASQVFEKMPRRDLVAWTAMIMSYAEMEMGEMALQLYAQMQHEGFEPDARTFVAALKACCSLAVQEEGKGLDGKLVKSRSLEHGKSIHDQVVKSGLELDILVANTMLDMYLKCGSLMDALKVFEQMPNHDAVSWTVMIMGYAQMEMGELALELYSRMQHENLPPNSHIFVAALKACGSVASLETGKEIHAEICRAGLENDTYIANCLIDMYGKCGSMLETQQLFDTLPTRDAVTWNSLISGYSGQGNCEGVFTCFQRMQQEGTQPDGVTFISILSMCSHTGLVDKGQMYFQVMCSEYKIVPSSEHYRCMVDLLGRASQLDEAVAVVKKISSRPDMLIWTTILGACQKWNNVDVGSHAFACAMRLEEKHAAAYVLMTNIYISAHMWEESAKLWEMRMTAEAWD